jgi:hypothetical protein
MQRVIHPEAKSQKLTAKSQKPTTATYSTQSNESNRF